MPGVLADGAWPASGDFGVSLVPLPDVADEEPLLAPFASLSFFILRSCFARLCLVGFAVSAPVVVSVLAPALAFGRLVFESTLALAVRCLRPRR